MTKTGPGETLMSLFSLVSIPTASANVNLEIFTHYSDIKTQNSSSRLVPCVLKIFSKLRVQKTAIERVPKHHSFVHTRHYQFTRIDYFDLTKMEFRHPVKIIIRRIPCPGPSVSLWIIVPTGNGHVLILFECFPFLAQCRVIWYHIKEQFGKGLRKKALSIWKFHWPSSNILSAPKISMEMSGDLCSCFSWLLWNSRQIQWGLERNATNIVAGNLLVVPIQWTRHADGLFCKGEGGPLY